MAKLNGRHMSCLAERFLILGVGARRFTEVALDSGAHVFAIDYSVAVDACL